MSYAIIGFGHIGRALAKAFARKGIEVSVATTRDPQSFAADAAAIGPTIIPKTLADAVKADVIFLAVRFEAHPDVAKALPNWQGKTIVDVTNAYGVPPEELGGQPSSKVGPHMAAGESYSWRVTTTTQQRRLVGLRKSSVSPRLNLAGFRKADCLSWRAKIAGDG